MHRIPRLRVTLFLAVAGCVMGAAAQAIPGRTLLWADEFTQADGTKPDSAKWGYNTGATGWGNNELQNYTDRTENARIEGGHLVIEARKESPGANNYTSARLLTKNKVSWTYGRIEARIKIPKGQGIWPAFWMLGANIDAVPWPACGEIDIMENIGSLPSTLYGTLHGPGYSGGGGISGNTVLPGAALGDDFHVYAIEWEENRIRWFLDGQQFFSLTPANLPNGSAWVFNAPQFLILNVAVGGNWPGSPGESTVFPQRMTVDYVRVYAPASGGGLPSGNQLQNPGFESGGLGGWTGVGPNVAVETGAFRNGARALKVFGQFSGGANESGAFQQLPATAGDEFAANAWLFTPTGDKIAGANSAWVEVTFRDASGAVLALHRSAAMTSASTAGLWQDFAVNQQLNPLTRAIISTGTRLVAPAGTATVRKQLVFRQPATAAGAVWFDDADLSEIPPVAPTPFTSWISGFDFSGIPAADLSAAGDPDRDGRENFHEFALNDDPRSAAVSAKVRSRIETVAGGPALVITLPVRGNPVFSGAPWKSAIADQLAYQIEGSDGLAVFDQVVMEIPASAAGMPTLDAGWNYRSFRLEGGVGSRPAGYLRVKMTAIP